MSELSVDAQRIVAYLAAEADNPVHCGPLVARIMLQLDEPDFRRALTELTRQTLVRQDISDLDRCRLTAMGWAWAKQQMAREVRAVTVPSVTEAIDAQAYARDRPVERRPRRLRLGRLGVHLALIVASLLMIYPLAFMTLGSLMTMGNYAHVTILPIPNPVSFQNYASFFTRLDHWLWSAVRITLLRVIWYVTVGVVVSLFAGYALSRLQFRGKNLVLMFFLGGLMVPSILTSLPTYMMLARFPLAGGNNLQGVGGHGFINEWPSLFILNWIDVVAIFLMKQSYDMLPVEYEEAAKIDGAGFFTVIFRVYAPMLRPALITVVIIIAVTVWNEYYLPLLVVGGDRTLAPMALTVQRVIYGMMGGGSVTQFPYPIVFATATIMSLPPLVLYLFLQRYFVQGLAMTGIKG